MDPSFFFDEDGKAYIVHCGIPVGPPKWDGHRAIWLHEYNTTTDKITGKGSIIADGGADTTQHPIWLEGPHLYKIKGTYYLMAAEGGTSEGHSEVIFKSDKVGGPYVAWKKNPILTQRNLPKVRDNKVSCTGHADLLQMANGEWMAVFLGCRPYGDEYYNTGRETFLLPVRWEEGFPVILDHGKAVPQVVSKMTLVPGGDLLTGNFVWRDEFDKPLLDLKWNMLRTPRERWWEVKDGNISLEALPRSLDQLVNPAFLGRRQQHLNYEAETAVKFVPKSGNELAGLVYFQNEKNYFVVGPTLRNGKLLLVLKGVTGGVAKEWKVIEIPSGSIGEEILLSLRVKEGEASFYFGEKGKKRIVLAEKVDVTSLSTKKGGGFVGAYVGMYATSLLEVR
jgi:alpha-N-arabinofuranosidase